MIAQTARFALGVALLVGVGSLAASCANVIGIGGDYADIATTYCVCPASDAMFDGSCASHVRSSLSRDPKNAANWLKAFVDESCDQCNDPVTGAAETGPWVRCAAVRPVCYELGQECSDPRACCGYAEGHASCIADVCTSCAAEGQPCSASADCCAGEYCGKHGASANTCVRELPSCHHTGGFCGQNSDCCGYEDGGAKNPDVACDTTLHTCFERCQLSAPDNCPGCCLSVLIGGTTAAGLCADGSPECARRCDPGGATACNHFLACDCRPFATTTPDTCAYTCGTN